MCYLVLITQNLFQEVNEDKEKESEKTSEKIEEVKTEEKKEKKVKKKKSFRSFSFLRKKEKKEAKNESNKNGDVENKVSSLKINWEIDGKALPTYFMPVFFSIFTFSIEGISV